MSDPKQYTLDGDLVDPPPDFISPPKKLAYMVKVHGQAPEGVKCGDCKHFLRIRRNVRVHRKCGLYGDSASEATDWLAGWPGCGLWELDDDG